MFKIFSTDICWINIKWGIWRVILGPSYIWDARFLQVKGPTRCTFSYVCLSVHLHACSAFLEKQPSASFLSCFAGVSMWLGSATSPSASPQCRHRSTTSCSPKYVPIFLSPNTTNCSVRLLIGRSRARNEYGAQLVSFERSSFYMWAYWQLCGRGTSILDLRLWPVLVIDLSFMTKWLSDNFIRCWSGLSGWGDKFIWNVFLDLCPVTTKSLTPSAANFQKCWSKWTFWRQIFFFKF